MPVTYEYIASQTANGSTTVTFSSIPQTYTDLVIDINAKANETGAYSIMSIILNGDTGSNYVGSSLYQLGSVNVVGGSAATTTATSQGFGYLGGGNSNEFGSGTLYLLNYATAAERAGFWLGSSGRPSTQLYGQTGSFVYANTSTGISTIALQCVTAAWDPGSNFYLYGIKRA